MLRGEEREISPSPRTNADPLCGKKGPLDTGDATMLALKYVCK